MGKVKDMFDSLKIRTKITMLCISVLILSFILSFVFFNLISEKKIEQEVGEVAMQTVSALKGNIDFIFDNVKQFSDLIYLDKNVQDTLANVSENIDAVSQQTIQTSLISMMISGDYLYSVHVFDKYNNYYFSCKEGPIVTYKSRLKETNWYQEMKSTNGGVLFIHKSEDVISFSSRPDLNYITLVREILNMYDYKPLATIMITVDEATIQGYFEDVGKEYQSNFCIIDSHNNYIIRPSDDIKSMNRYIIDSGEDDSNYRLVSDGNNKAIVVQQSLGIRDWKLVGAIPMNFNNSSFTKFYSSWIMLVISINLLFVFCCFLLLTKLIFKPLNKMQKHMRLVERGDLMEMKVDTKKMDEISTLKKVFNQMITSISELIEKVKKEEQIIAKSQLEIIQAQINPHFLYNTLDAVSALALIGDNNNCLKMTQALGSFYRNSLNSGRDLITIKDEIDCIKSYVTILNMRYDNKINFLFEIEEEIMEYRILKLILQPIVENSVHHGIRNKKNKGNITIKGYKDEDEIIFIINDDGLGMSEERIKDILAGRTKQEKSGFGLYSSIQRISLYYEIENPITITSEVGIGTEIAIRVKVIKGEGAYEDKSITGG